jgi:hypothetical protein
LSTLSTSDRLKIAFGGFTSFTGFVILVMVILSATGAADIRIVLQNDFLVAMILFVGCLDLVCGLLLIFRERKIKWLFTPHQKQPNHNVDQTHEAPDRKTE